MAGTPEDMDALDLPADSIEDLDASFSSSGSQEDHPDNDIDNGTDSSNGNGLCSHLRATLGDEKAREKLIGKYKNVVAWNVNRTQDALHAVKRRKVNGVHDTPSSAELYTGTCVYTSAM